VLKKLTCTFLMLSIIAIPVAMNAEDAVEACTQAKADVEREVSSALWLFAGCLFGVLGVGAAYLIEPSPSAMSLLGKSPEYAAAYTDCYKEQGRKIQLNKAATGCLVGSAVGIGLGVLYFFTNIY
jgi:hypothetical protein